MKIGEAFATILGSAVVFAAMGTGLGLLLGRYVPSYYRNVFSHGRDVAFDPVGVGIGQGLTQGFAGGVVVGLALVAIISWTSARSLPADTDSERFESGSTRRKRHRLLFWGSMSFLLLAIYSTVLFVVGAFAGEMLTNYRHFQDQRSVVAPVLYSDEAFKELQIDESSTGHLLLFGELRDQAEFDRLRGAVEAAVGRELAGVALRNVKVAD